MTIKRIFCFTLFFALLLFAFTLTALAAENQTGVINATDVRLRSQPSTDASIVSVLEKNAKVTVLQKSGDWYQITASTQTGFVLSSFVTVNIETEEATVPAQSVPVAMLHNDNFVDNTFPGLLRQGSDNKPCVIRLQRALVSLGYLDGMADGLFGGGTHAAVRDFQFGNGLADDGMVGEETWNLLFSGEALSAKDALKRPQVEMLDWFVNGKTVMKAGTIATVTDVDTGISFKIRVLGPGNHADSEPLTAEDAEKILKIRGKHSWTPRAIVVTVGGQKYAASCNGMPHDVQTIKDNNFSGHFCIHFLNSRNHYNNKPDPDHQKQVQRAYHS